MIIKNNTKSLIILPGKSGKTTAGGLKASLLIGCNYLTESEYNQIKDCFDTKIMKGKIENKQIEIVTEEIKKDGKVKKAKDLKDFTAKKAVKVVKETYSKKTLNEFSKQEVRDEVRANIKDQIDQVNKTGKKKKPSEDE